MGYGIVKYEMSLVVDDEGLTLASQRGDAIHIKAAEVEDFISTLIMLYRMHRLGANPVEEVTQDA